MSEVGAARILWWLTGLVFLGVGVGRVWWPATQQIAQIRAHSREMYDEANQNDRAIRRGRELRSVRERVAADMRQLSGQESRGAAIASALRFLSDESKRFDVDLRSVVPAELPLPIATPPVNDVLVPSSVTLGMRGKFRNVVAMLADVPRHDVLLAIQDVSLQATDNTQGVPVLAVTVQATLYRVRSQTITEGAYAPSAP